MEKLRTGMPVVKESQGITVDKIKGFLPKGSGVTITEDIVKIINSIEDDTGLDQYYAEEQIMSSLHLLDGKGSSLEKLTNAIKYCNLKQHYNNLEAWSIVFPVKYKKLVDEGRFVDSHVSMFNNSKLVVAVEKTMLLPAHITYQPLFHKAIQKQYDLMMGKGAKPGEYVSPHIQHLAAKELTAMTQIPEETNVNLKVGLSDEAKTVQQEMIEQLSIIAKNQKQALNSGKSILEVQRLGINVDEIIDAQVEE